MARRLIRTVLGGGALAFGIYGVVAPRSLARMLGSDDEKLAREIGLRDIGNALVFASGSNRTAMLQRMLFDVSDAAQFGRRKPKVAAGALAFAALGAVGVALED